MATIKIDFGSNGGTIAFETVGEVENWVNELERKWEWRNGNSAKVYSKASSNVQNGINQIKNALNTVRSQPLSNESAWQEFSQNAARPFREKQLLHETTPEFRFVSELAASVNPATASGALAAFQTHCQLEAGFLQDRMKTKPRLTLRRKI
jgi:hypothetical protein